MPSIIPILQRKLAVKAAETRLVLFRHSHSEVPIWTQRAEERTIKGDELILTFNPPISRPNFEDESFRVEFYADKELVCGGTLPFKTDTLKSVTIG